MFFLVWILGEFLGVLFATFMDFYRFWGPLWGPFGGQKPSLAGGIREHVSIRFQRGSREGPGSHFLRIFDQFWEVF